jgi:hypothetical protein
MPFICRLVVLLATAAIFFHTTESVARDVVFGNISIHPATNLHSKSDRAAAAIKISDYLKDSDDSLKALPRPNEPMMQMYQKKYNYMSSVVGINNKEYFRIYEELQKDAKAVEILRYHARDRLLRSLGCLKQVASMSREEEFKCFSQLELATESDLWITRRYWEDFQKHSEEPRDLLILSTAVDWFKQLGFGTLGAARLRFESAPFKCVGSVPQRYLGRCGE